MPAPQAGTGFVCAHCGDERIVPGLPARAAYVQVDLADGQGAGLH